jgi:hypothetical protein
LPVDAKLILDCPKRLGQPSEAAVGGWKIDTQTRKGEQAKAHRGSHGYWADV